MHGPARPGRGMDAEALLRAALREAGYGPDAIGSALPRIMRILQAEDVRIEAGRPLSRKEREYVRVQLELGRSEEHTSELPSLMRISYAVFCLKKKTKAHNITDTS